MSAVQARVHYTMKQEFKLLAAIIRDNTPDSYDYQPEVGSKSAKKADYDLVEVIPVSDPNASTMSQRVVQYQAVLQLSQSAPQIYDLPFLHRQMIDTLGVKHSSKIVPIPDDMKPVDPVSENMAIMMGKPVKAFLIQDHEAHLAVHMAAMHDPKLAAVMGQNPQAQALQAAAMAHIMEHVAFQYRKEIEKQLGASLPPMEDEDGEETHLPPEIEAQISQLAAQAAGQLLQKNQAEAQQQQAQQQAQDPLVQMQMQEIQIKQGELERKKAKDQQEAQMKLLQISMQSENNEARNEIEGTRMGMDMKKHEASTQAQQLSALLQQANQAQQADSQRELEGAKLGVDIAKHKSGFKNQQNSPNPGATAEE
jgi:hypothetical protein